MKSKIFISFSTYDGNDIARFVYEFYRKIGFEVFYSEKEIPFGNVWEQEIIKRLEQCDVFLLIATPEALGSQQVAREVCKAKRLKKRIIPCRYTGVNWSDLKKLEADLFEGIEFDNPYEIIRKLGRWPHEGIVAAVSEHSTSKNTGQHHERRINTPSTSKRWLALEIKKRLDDASELERRLAFPADTDLWMLETESFLKESFGENSPYFRLFPKIMRFTSSAFSANLNPTANFNEAKEQLRDILEDIQEEREEDNNSSSK